MSFKKINYDKYDVLGYTQVNAIQDAIVDMENGLSDFNDQLNLRCKIVTGSYVGDGKYGSLYPKKITFDGKPVYFRLVRIKDDDTRFTEGFSWFNGLPMALSNGYDQTNSNAIITTSDNAIEWYYAPSNGSSGVEEPDDLGSPTYSTNHYNLYGKQYYYMAIVL